MTCGVVLAPLNRVFAKTQPQNVPYTYKLGHKLSNSTIIWSQIRQFKSYPRKERERFKQADQDADEWRAKEIANKNVMRKVLDTCELELWIYAGKASSIMRYTINWLRLLRNKAMMSSRAYKNGANGVTKVLKLAKLSQFNSRMPIVMERIAQGGVYR
nr:hypothetical protein [Tanacetum cinerariifolium]